MVGTATPLAACAGSHPIYANNIAGVLMLSAKFYLLLDHLAELLQICIYNDMLFTHFLACEVTHSVLLHEMELQSQERPPVILDVSDVDDALELSRDHMLFAEKGGSIVSTPTSLINVGNKVIVGSNGDKLGEVLKVANVSQKGAYAPFTTSGKILVNNVLASRYVSFISDKDMLEIGGIKTPLTMQWIAHTFKAPHRLVCSLNFSYCKNEMYTDVISNWVVGPYGAGQWLLKQNMLIQVVSFSVFTTCLALLSVVEAATVVVANQTLTCMILAVTTWLYLCMGRMAMIKMK